MITKICPGCKEELLLDSFSKDPYRKNGLQTYCKKCRSAQNKSYNKENRSRLNARRKETRNLRFLYVLKLLSTKSCVDCGETDPVVLDFDHIKDVKTDNISTMLHDIRPLNIIQEEINKCEIRCANCHRRKTAKEQNWYSYIDFSTMTLKTS